MIVVYCPRCGRPELVWPNQVQWAICPECLEWLADVPDCELEEVSDEP